MQATDELLTKILKSDVQFFVPIYQRKYDWEERQCEKLLDDIIQVANDKNRPMHFIGSIIHLSKYGADHASALVEELLIDGQQRLTTISLLLLALGDYTKGNNAVTSLEQLKKKYLVNEDEKDDLYYKIRLNEEDFNNYKKLLIDRSKPEDTQSRIFDNYYILLNKMKKLNIDPQIIFDGIKKLKIVNTVLLKEDNAQLVFETVNSTGKPLSIPDKIRNFILMNAEQDQQSTLYNEYWHKMELAFGIDKGNVSDFIEFFRYYMTAMLKKQIGNEYYEDFKTYFFGIFDGDVTPIVKNIYNYSKYFDRFKKASKDSKGIDECIFKIKETKQYKVVPAILKIIDDVVNKRITENSAEKVLGIIESYWVRRALCNLPTNTAGPACITMLNNLNDYNNYAENFIESIKNLTWAQRMPDDQELYERIRTVDIYNKYFVRTLLDKLEKSQNKDYIHDEGFTIEHIMPQTINDPAKNEKEDWIKDLGDNWQDIHNKYLNTLGNLTLSGYNPEYKNYRFKIKKEMKNGYNETPIRISYSLRDSEKWGEDEIIKRADEMSGLIVKIWKYPKI